MTSVFTTIHEKKKGKTKPEKVGKGNYQDQSRNQ